MFVCAVKQKWCVCLLIWITVIKSVRLLAFYLYTSFCENNWSSVLLFSDHTHGQNAYLFEVISVTVTKQMELKLKKKASYNCKQYTSPLLVLSICCNEHELHVLFATCNTMSYFNIFTVTTWLSTIYQYLAVITGLRFPDRQTI